MPAFHAVQYSYTFDELSDCAKEAARDWWRSAESSDFDASATIEDAATIADLMGIDLRTRPVKLMNGGTRYEPCIWYSGFCSQGDGACFEGSYSYRKGSVAAVKSHAPHDQTLHAIVQGLADVQRANFYRLEASVSHSGRYYHSHSTSIDVTYAGDDYRDLGAAEETVRDLLRDFMDWIYRQLEAEYEYTMSAESVDESIRINEYTFDENGRIP